MEEKKQNETTVSLKNDVLFYTISIERYNSLVAIEDNEKHAAACLLKFIFNIKDKLPYHEIVNAITKTGYKIVVESSEGVSVYGEGELIIKLLTNK